MSFYDHVKTHHVVELDACLAGLGGRWENLVYHLPLPNHYKNLGIVQLEMINILVAIRVFVSLWHRKSKKDIQAIYKHIPGKINQVADLLSRWKNATAQLAKLQPLVENPMRLHTHMGLLDLDNDI